MTDSEFSRIERQVTDFVTKAYTSPDVPHYPYHNLVHTQGVVAHVREIAAHYSCLPQEVFILTIAAWFHDIGHQYGGIEGHEARGVVVMEQYLNHIPADMRKAIGGCILATKLPAQPHTLAERIICDADTYHLGTLLFRQTDPLVRQEMEQRKGTPIADWSRKTLVMLGRHTFFTDYCIGLLSKGKEENIAWVQAQLG